MFFMMIKRYAMLIKIVLVVALTIGAGYFGYDYGKNKTKATYEAAANRQIKEAQKKFVQQLKEKDRKIKELDAELQNQTTIIKESQDECLDVEVPSDIKSLLDADRLQQ